MELLFECGDDIEQSDASETMLILKDGVFEAREVSEAEEFSVLLILLLILVKRWSFEDKLFKEDAALTVRGQMDSEEG